MFKYSTIFTAIIFLCAFLGCTISEDNLPNAEEALQKVSGIIDLNNLNVSGNPALDNVNASVIKHALEESQSVFKQKCDKNGGEGTFENAINAMNDLEQCLKSFVNFTKLEKEMERHKPTGDLDTVFKTYCRKTPTLKKCVSNFTTAIEPCLEPQERENKKIIQNITDSLLTFVCYKEGDRIALFISANGPECLQSKQQEIQQCVNITLGSYIPQTDLNNGPGLNSLPLLVFGTKECTDISKVQSCIVRELEKCKDPVPANIVDSIFNYIIKVTPCQKVINLQNTASSSTIIENAIMLKRFNRYPLIIDPSGQATEFIMNEFKDRKITKTSFLDDSFRKNLESALRFGNPLLVQDVENYDPILNPVLNRELRRTGGRVLITLGDQDIDLSPSFVIFLSTRDPTVEFPPDICSRVTFVNFTVTRSSLQSQCLNQVLKAERPDIDEKRSDLLKLQGEFHLRLRQLEKSLLQALNDAKGKILDDDSVITTLETLKQEAADISKKVEETDKVIGEIETVSQQYMPLSQACSNMYFTMDSLNQVHFLYQYSLKMFLDVFTSVLSQNPRLSNISDYTQRLSVITSDLFSACYERVARGMLHTDRLTFALLLCRIHLKGIATESTYDSEFTFFLRGKEGVLNIRDPIMPNLSSEQQEALMRLSLRLPAFKKLREKIQENIEFNTWLQSPTPETCVPKLWDEEKPLTPTGTAMHQLLIIQAFRPDRVIAAASLVVISALGESFMAAAEAELDFASVVENELKATVPALLCSVPGFDASGRVDDLAAESGKQIASIAIGSAEGFNQADRAINMAVKAGRWVLLKNVHLAPQWLVQLEKKLHSLQPHTSFRLFLTMEINPKVPVNLLRAGRIFVFEPPPGIRANLLRTFSTVPASRMMKVPNERARLYFLLAWFHAIVQERLRYAPLGWAKHYEFNESDLRVACDTLDTWIEATAMGRTNLPPEKVPWDALVTLLSQCIYGGKIDNDFDQRLLASFLRKLFTPRSFETDFALVANIDGLQGGQRHITMPDGTRRDHFLKWIESLSDRQTPSWLGLPNNAEKVLLTTRGTDLVSKLLKMQQLEDEDELAYSNEESLDTPREAEADGRPSWMRTLHNSASTWLQLLPKNLPTLKRTVENIKDPLYRYFEREVNSGAKLLQDVIHDLEDVVLICQGKKKQTNYHRTMLSELVKGILPGGWRRYTVPRGCTVIQWITDFSHRVSQLQEVSRLVSQGGAKEIKSFPVWLGGLLNPEAYITATRQCIAQANSWSLEELQLDVTIGDSDNIATDDCSFAVTGLKLQGAQCKDNQLYLTSTIMTDLPVTMLRWIRSATDDVRKGKLSLPVYLNSTRTELLFTVDLNIAPSQDPHSFYERGVAVLTSTALN